MVSSWSAASAASCDLCKGSLGSGVLPVTISCHDCVDKYRSAEGMLQASQTRAKEEFGLSQADLDVLNYTTKRNPHNIRSPIKLFVRSELEILRKRNLAAAALKLVKDKKEVAVRVERLAKRHKIDHETIGDASLKEAIFGDFLSSLKPATKVGDIKLAYKLMSHARSILPSNPARVLNFFMYNKLKVPRGEDEQAEMAKRFWENADLLECVVAKQPASKLIVQFLSPSEARGLEKTNMKRLLDTANINDGKKRDRLKKALENLGGIPDIDEFLNDVAVSDRLKRFEDHGSDEAGLARKLHDFHRLRRDARARRELLSKAMTARDVSTTDLHRSSADLHRKFVEGSIDVDLDEIVGLTKISQHLCKLGGGFNWVQQHEAVADKFKNVLHLEGLCFKTAYERSVKGCRVARHKQPYGYAMSEHYY